MLRKLIKYDIKSNIKIVAGTYSFILLLAILHLIMDKLTKIYPGAIQWMALEELTFVLHILGIWSYNGGMCFTFQKKHV